VSLLVLSAAWLAGLALAASGHAAEAPYLAPVGLGVAVALAQKGRQGHAAVALVAVGLALLGALRFEGAAPRRAAEGLALYNDGAAVAFRGQVGQEPERRGSTQRLLIEADQVRGEGGWTATSGRVLVTVRAFPTFAYGDYLELRGKLKTPPAFDDFDYREYLARRGVASVSYLPEVSRLDSGRGDALEAAVIRVRERLAGALGRALPEPEAALAQGMLLGQRSSIPAGLTEAFNRAGISHLIAISGSNVTLVAGLALAGLTPLLGRRRAVVGAMVLVCGFVLLVGASASVARAGVMGLLMLGAVLAGRPGSALTAVALAAALLTAWRPMAALDVSFQLSFAATLGLVLLQPWLERSIVPLLARVVPAGPAAFLGETVAVTAAASIAVLPITAAYFGRVSLVAIPANIVAVPLFEATIVTSALTAVAGVASSRVAELAGQFALVPLGALVECARWFGSLPGAAIAAPRSGVGGALAFYLALGLVALWGRRVANADEPAREQRRGSLALGTSALVLVAAGGLWLQVLTHEDGRLVVTVLDVGQGDAILVEAPGGQRILVDGGPSGPAVLAALARELPAGARRLDLVVLTHPQEDHVAGLVDVTSRYDVRAVAVSGTTSPIGSFQAWQEEVAARAIPVQPLSFGEAALLPGGLRIDVLNPNQPYLRDTEDDLNNNAVVLRLTYGRVSFLLTADLGPEGEERLLAETGDLHATVLKVGHHGSATSTGDALLAAVRPSVAVISVGTDNIYGHPSPSTLLRLAGLPVFRTDRNGSVRFETDGERLFVRPERGSYQLVPVSAVR
jgi:competence protein ComEC